MKITVLEHPRVRSEEHFNDIANTPLWSCLMGGYAASALSHSGHEVYFADTALRGLNFKEVEDLIESQNPDLLCINAVYFWEYTGWLFEMLGNLRKNGFEGHITLIGFFPTLAYNAILANERSVDSIIAGECEDRIVALAERIEKRNDLSGIPGVAIMRNDVVSLKSGPLESGDPDRFHFPERVLADKSQTAGILASRGCYNHCAFCPVPSFYGNGPLWKGRSPENIVQEMGGLIEQGFHDFYFVDPNFIGPGKKGRQRAEELMEMIKPMNITFGMETRPNDLDPALFKKLVDSGLTGLLLGVESGSKAVLYDLNKGAGATVSEEAIKVCRDFGVEPEIGFLMFVPDATLEDLEINYEFLLRNNLLDRLDRTANLLGHRQIVMMGTSGFRMYEKQGRLKRKGVLGFEGDVLYRDERVKWMSDAMIFACLSVLEKMEDADSPIFWKNKGKDEEYEKISEKVNDYLMRTFTDLLGEVKKDKFFLVEEKYQEKIREDIISMAG